jgi:hypothetical protein
VSAVVAGISVAAKNSSPLGSYLDFADAFVLTLPLSIGIAFTVWFALEEHLMSHGALFVKFRRGRSVLPGCAAVS